MRSFISSFAVGTLRSGCGGTRWKGMGAWGFAAAKARKLAMCCGVICTAALALAQHAYAAPPTPSISTLSNGGPAPFTVHVNALNTNPGGGTKLTARYEWNFGDPAGQFNILPGWNAAHIYDQPGTYIVTLKVTNQDGQQATTTRVITVSSNNRTGIYVSPTGNDNNPGTQSQPIQTFVKAAQLVGNNKAVYFRRNATYTTSSIFSINHQNVLIGAYGTGSSPVIHFTSGASYADIFSLSTSAADVVIENITITSPFVVDNVICRGIRTRGQRITVRNCHFGNISYAMNCGGGGAVGLFSLNNTTGTIGAYYVWAEGSDHTHIGNTVGGSTHEHNIRLGGCQRVLLAHNNLTNLDKSCIWCMLGDHAYIANNTLQQGRLIIGPNFALGGLSERFLWAVVENTRIVNEGMIFYSGAEDLMIRNNIIRNDGGTGLSIWGYYAPMNRTVKRVTAMNNTGINLSPSWGHFSKIGAGAETVKLGNNLYCAPSLNTQNGSANVRSDDPNLNTHLIHNNIWANPATGSAHHFLSTGGVTAGQWASYSQTQSEMYRTYNGADLSATFAPQFSAAGAVVVPGVFTDYYGNPRPSSNWTVGAVELNPSGGGGGNSPDINGDGMVSVDDLLSVISHWGACPPPASGACLADLNGNGIVNIDDLVVVLANWSM